ncbi:hypothetical protein ACKVV1_010811 [Pyricularia oryzae]
MKATLFYLAVSCQLTGALAGPIETPYMPVTLADYGTFSGLVVTETFTGKSLPSPVDAWLGMDYATQPVGDNRFRAVGWPAPFDGIKPAIEFKKACPQAVTEVLPNKDQAEDCLQFNVWRTPGVPLDEKLPVMIWFMGGAFNRGNQKLFDGGSFVANSPKPMVFVSFHHRIGALGFPTSDLFERHDGLNLGVRDSRLLLEFVQKHISSFGGDPDTVTIGGLSAGAHGVGIQHIGNNSDSAVKPLFARVYYESGSSTARAFPGVDYPMYQKQFSEFLELTGCNSAGDDDEATIACLRAIPWDALRDASVGIFNRYDKAVTWPWQPVQGGPLFAKSGSQSMIDGTFYHVPVISSSTTDEARRYIPGNLETDEEFLDFMHNISPTLTEDDMELMAKLYPDPATDPNSPYKNSINSTQFSRLSDAWSDYAYICPSQENSYRSAAAGLPVWKSRWNAGDNLPAWRGIQHATDMSYIWTEPTVEFPELGKAQHAYIASFALTGDPNTYRLAGSPEWPKYKPEGYGIESAAPDQLVMNPGGPEIEKDDARREACLFWRDPERAPRLNK